MLFPGVGRVHEIVALGERAGHSTRSITLVFHMVDGPQCRNWSFRISVWRATVKAAIRGQSGSGFYSTMTSPREASIATLPDISSS